jgi:hypothetical protein
MWLQNFIHNNVFIERQIIQCGKSFCKRFFSMAYIFPKYGLFYGSRTTSQNMDFISLILTKIKIYIYPRFIIFLGQGFFWRYFFFNISCQAASSSSNVHIYLLKRLIFIQIDHTSGQLGPNEFVYRIRPYFCEDEQWARQPRATNPSSS